MPPSKEPSARRKSRKSIPAVPSNGAGEYAAEAARKTPEQIDLGEISTAVSWMRTGTDKFFQVHNYNPDELVARKGLKTYKKMRHDEQVKAALKTVKQAAVSTGWEIEEPKIEGGEEIADEMKRFVEFNVGTDAGGGEMAGTMEQKLMEMMTAIDFGYSCTEPTLKYIEYGEFEGFTGIKELKTRDPENIHFVTDQYGNLLDDGVVQFGRRLPEDRFAIYSHDKEFDNWYGTSMLRAAYRPWWIKDTLLKFMTIAMERYGEPIAVATTKKKLTDAERSRLEAMFKSLQNRTLITIPEFITLEFKVPQQRAGDAYASVMAKLDSWISRAILLPTKMGMSGESETGNYSQASEEFDLFLQIIGYLRRVVAALTNDRIVKPVVDLNYEVTGGNYPKFAFKSITQERKDSIYKLFLEGLGRSALTKVPADENRLRNLIDFPELTEEEQAQAEAEKQAMQEQFQSGDSETEEEHGGTEEEFFPFEKSSEYVCVYCGVRRYHLPGEHDQCDHSPTGECESVAGGTEKIQRVRDRVFRGASVKLKKNISKIETGKIGEALASRLTGARKMNGKWNNFPIDLVRGDTVYEVKTGLASNRTDAQKWRLTIGEPGKKESEWLKTASENARAKWNERKAAMIRERKMAVMRDLSRRLGRPIRSKTMTFIINPDKRTADMFEFDGFHPIIRWRSPQTAKAYKGSFSYAR